VALINQQSVTPRTGELFNNLQFRDFLDIAIRRKWWIILTALAVSTVAVVLAIRLPNVYRAETIILVDAQKVPETYVASTVNSSIADRLATIQQQVTSATRLRRLIDSMNLYPQLRGVMSEQSLIQRMQNSISVEEVSQGGRLSSAFRIAFADRDPVETARVTSQLASMFIEENVKAREQQSYGTAEFLESELEKTRKELDEKEKVLKKVKSQYIMDLPDSKQYHVEALESLRTQLRDAQDRVNRAQQQKVYLQSAMVAAAPTVDLDTSSGGSPYQSEIERHETRLAGLRVRYGPSHPDIRKLQTELDELKAKQAEEEKNAAPTVVQTQPEGAKRAIHNPVVEAQLDQLNREIAEQLQIEAKQQNEVNFHVSKLQKVPIVEQQLSNLARDYDTLKAYYVHLLDKKLSADTASALESHQKGERFVILDPAQVPDKPHGPNRLLIALAGVVGGILGGVGLAILRENADTSVRSEREVNEILGISVLAGIPVTMSRGQIWQAKVRAAFAVVGTVAGSVVLGFAVSFLNERFF
jgi:polysaccharide biosynthesis transport protein